MTDHIEEKLATATEVLADTPITYSQAAEAVEAGTATAAHVQALVDNAGSLLYLSLTTRRIRPPSTPDRLPLWPKTGPMSSADHKVRRVSIDPPLWGGSWNVVDLRLWLIADAKRNSARAGKVSTS